MCLSITIYTNHFFSFTSSNLFVSIYLQTFFEKLKPLYQQNNNKKRLVLENDEMWLAESQILPHEFYRDWRKEFFSNSFHLYLKSVGTFHLGNASFKIYFKIPKLFSHNILYHLFEP